MACMASSGNQRRVQIKIHGVPTKATTKLLVLTSSNLKQIF